MLAKLAILVLLPAGLDANTATTFLGRWQVAPAPGETASSVTFEFRQLKEKPTEEELQILFFSFKRVILVDQVEFAKGYLVAHLLQSNRDLGPGGGKRVFVEFTQQKDEYPLTMKIGEGDPLRLKALTPVREQSGDPKTDKPAALEYIRLTPRTLQEGSVAGLKFVPSVGPDLNALTEVLNYLGGQGWDVVFDHDTLVGKRSTNTPRHWEFLILQEVSPDRDRTRSVSDKVLTHAGNEGWELVGVFDSNKAIFKRPRLGPIQPELKTKPSLQQPKPGDFSPRR